MSRIDIPQTWGAQFPGSNKSIEGVYPTTAMSTQACESVGRQLQKQNLQSAQAEANENLLRICLRKFDGEELTFRKLIGPRLNRMFTPKELSLLRTLFKDIREPSDVEISHFEQTMHTESRGDNYIWSAEIQDEQTLQRIDELEERKLVLELDIEDELENDEPREQYIDDTQDEVDTLSDEIAALESSRLFVRGVLPNTHLAQKSMNQTRGLDKDQPLVVQKVSTENLLRNCVREYQDGEDNPRVDVSFSVLKGTGIDEHFTPKEMNIITYGIVAEAEPTDEEAEDFLDTVQVD